MYSLLKYSSIRGKGLFVSAQLKLAYAAVACLLVVGVTSVSWAKAGSSPAKPFALRLANTAPTTTGIASQTVSVFESFSLNAASAFSDAETPNSLTFSQTQLPFDLQLNPTTGLISGTARFDGIYNVTITATDPEGLSVSTRFSLTIDPDTKKELVLTAIANPSQILTTGRSNITMKTAGGIVPYQVVGVEGPGTLVVYPFGTADVTNLPVGVHTFICKVKDATNKVVSAPVSITVTEPLPLSIRPSASPNRISPTGTSVLNPNIIGGIPPYYFDLKGPGIISTSIATYTVGNLPVGVHSYTMTVTDSQEQKVSGTVSLRVVPANPPPVVVTPIADLTVTVGQSFSVNTANLFSYPHGDSLIITVGTLPSSIKFYNNIISGSFDQPGTTKIDLFAYHRSSSAGASFYVIAVPDSTTNPAPFSITRVNLASCQTVTASERRISFTPQYSGLTGQPILFSVTNELAPTANAGPYSLRVYTDNPTITLKATQAGTAGEASFSYNWLAACSTNTPSTTMFAITGVNTVRCEVVTAGERRLTFTPQYSGQTTEPISFSVVNELLPTSQPGPYALRVYTDNPVITLVAQQAGQQARFSYNWLASCTSSNARRGVEPQEVLQVSVLGNPVRDEQVSFEVRGANAQPLQLRLLTPQGQVVTQRQVASPQIIERHQLSLGGQAGGVFLLQVSTPTQSQTVKVIKAN